ncbi:putative aminoadipate reductase [Mycena amicta]|nr:putative aminoadipate reductase [Mycena amicta]
MTNTLVLPPLDGSLNASEGIDFHLTNHNLPPAYSYATEDGTLTNITHFEFARAAHRAAHLLRPQRNGLDGQVVAIVALTDTLLYQTVFAGCITAGLVVRLLSIDRLPHPLTDPFKPFPLSHRNSDAALKHLLTASKSQGILTTHGSLGQVIDSLAADLLAQQPSHALAIHEIPTLAQLYPVLGRETPEDAFTPYPQPKDKAALDELAFYLHSSGSTGLPKPIPFTHRYVLSVAGLGVLAQLAEVTPRLAVGALPAFHAMGSFTQFMSPIFLGLTACIYPPVSTAEEYRAPANATPENALENAKKAGANGILTVPAFLLQWAQNEEDVEYLKSLNLVVFGGGPLPTRVGDYLVGQGVKLAQVYGGTEVGVTNNLFPRDILPNEWNWMQFSDRVNLRWAPLGDGTFECQVLCSAIHSPAIEDLPDVRGYATKDFFEQHPTKPHLYKVLGRLDDVLMMVNGEKTVPGPMEDILNASPYISGALMFGRERNQIGVLVEPAPAVGDVNSTDDNQLGEFRNLVWSVVEQANAIAPAFAKVYKEMILVTRPDRPFVRAPKGTVVRKMTMALYEAEITALYETIEESENAANDVALPTSWMEKDLERWLLTHASALAGKKITPATDLFNQGFDSLHATFLRHRIVAALRKDKATVPIAQTIPQNLVYTHPSVQQLAAAIEGLVAGHASADADPRALVEAMIAKYSQGFDVLPQPGQRAPSSGGAVILLTGSTGGLGSHILDLLLRHSSVERVYAFNRPSRTSISQRQEAAFRDRALDVELLRSQKLVYLEGDSAREDLGISKQSFAKLKSSVTVVIHNAWVLDFNKSLSTFEPLVRGTRNLIDLARLSRAQFLFASSIGSAQSWERSKGAFPEELQLDAGVAIGNGYGESKYVSERILAASGLPATSFRIGQITGANSNGAWSTTDWVPAIVKSSIALGNFPSDPTGTVSWLPSEAVAQCIVDVAFLPAEGATPFAVNIVHPRPVTWDAVMGAMARVAQLPLVPLAQWLAQLDKHAKHASAEDMETLPAIKLLDFLKSFVGHSGNAQFTTTQAQRVSQTLDTLPQLGEEDVRRWMAYWRSVGFIH